MLVMTSVLVLLWFYVRYEIRRGGDAAAAR
jgi:hypothetical protein